MDTLFYVLIVIGAIMVYGAGRILKLFKQEDNMGAFIALKFSGLVIAIIGMAKIMKFF